MTEKELIDLEIKNEPWTWAIRIAALAVIIAFFLPFCAVSCHGEEIDLSAGEIAIGYYQPDSSNDDYENTLGPNLEEIGDSYPLALFLPVGGVIAFILGRCISYGAGDKKFPIATVICGSAILAITLMMQNKVESFVHENGATCDFKIGCHLLILGGIVIAGCGAIIWYRTTEYQRIYNTPSIILRGGSINSSDDWFCSSCGAHCAGIAKFCEKCGSQRISAISASSQNGSSAESTEENNYLTRLAHEKKESNTSIASHYWTCEKCGCRNPKTLTSCNDCGDERY